MRNWNSHAIDKYDTFLSVLGRVKIHRMTNPTTPQTMLQVALSVIEFIAIVNVKICEPITV